MKIGIFGGAFNPIHNGHLSIAEQLISFNYLDEVWLLPCFSHVWNKSLNSPDHRKTMIDKALAEICNPKIILSTFELDQHKPMYTIDTVKLLKRKYPQNKLFWIIGSDNLQNFDKWHKKNELLELIHFFVAPKSGVAIPANLPPNMESVQNPLWVETNLSSTIVRDRVQKGLPVKGLVPQSIENDVLKLYKV